MQKCDGHRLLIQIEDGQVTFLNRAGEPKATGVTPGIRAEFARFSDDNWVFDSELIDDTLWLFDMPIAGDIISLDSPFNDRYEIMEGMYDRVLLDSPCVRILPLARTTGEKTKLLEDVRTIGGEGVIYRKLDSTYQPGMRSRDLLKWKLRHEVDCIVVAKGIDGKDNLRLAVYNEGQLQVIGECTALAGDGQRAEIGSVVAVTYLYYGAGGRLYQPTSPKLRDGDKYPEECTFDQLVHVNKTVVA